MTQPSKQTGQSGFTLVELAIVLVIIGLIVGGVLVGQDLIRAAEIRAVVTDIEKYNAAANTFRTKYNGVPGDLRSDRAASFGLIAGDGSAGQRDGNGLVEGGAANSNALGFENTTLWVDLTAAQLIPKAFTTQADANTAAASITTTMGLYLPNIRLRDSTYMHVFPVGGRNWYAITGIVSGALGAITTSAGLRVFEAQSIDEKVDDGFPTTGTAVAFSGFSDPFSPRVGATANDDDAGAASATGVCVNTDPAGADEYNIISEAFGNEINCRLRIRAAF